MSMVRLLVLLVTIGGGVLQSEVFEMGDGLAGIGPDPLHTLLRGGQVGLQLGDQGRGGGFLHQPVLAITFGLRCSGLMGVTLRGEQGTLGLEAFRQCIGDVEDGFAILQNGLQALHFQTQLAQLLHHRHVLGQVDGVVQLQQQFPRLDTLAVPDVDGTHQRDLRRMQQLGLAFGQHLARCHRSHIDPGHAGPDQ